MSIRMEILADNMGDLYSKLEEHICRKLNAYELAETDTDALLEEIRRRLNPQGLILSIHPPAVGTEVAQTTPAPKRGRPSNKDKTTAAEPPATDKVPEKSENSVTEPEPSVREQASEPSQPAKTVEPVTGPLDASAAGQATTPAQDAPTRDEVIVALNAYAAPRGGQVAGRTKMQEVCGVNRLQDIKPEDYGKLVAALKAAA